MQNYVLGFAFDTHGERLALIRKNRPTWQAGRLNGIGGKLEPGESAIQAMVREFAEEAGVATKEKDWRLLGALRGAHFQVWVYGSRLPAALFDKLTSLTDEKVEVVWFNDPAWPAQALDTVPVLAQFARKPIADLHLVWGYDDMAGPAPFEELIRGPA
jgi:8-oxo-dGTP diphosphatase